MSNTEHAYLYRKKTMHFILLLAFCFGISTSLYAAEPPASLKQVKIDYEEEFFEEALEQLLVLQPQQPNHIEINLYLGLTYQKMLDYTKAITFLKQCIALDANQGKAHAALGDVYYARNQPDEAIIHLDQAITLKTNVAYSTYLKGLVLIQRQEFSQAIPFLKQAMQLDPNFTQKAQYSLGVAHFHAGNDKESEAFFKKASNGKDSTASAMYAKLSLDAIKKRSQSNTVKEFELIARYAVSYDDNVVLKPAQLSIPMSVSSEKDKRHDLTLFAHWQPDLQNAWLFSADYRFYANGHLKLKQLNVQGHTLTLSPAYVFSDKELGLQAVLDYYLVNSTRYVGIAGLYPHFRFVYNPQHTGTIRLGLNAQSYFLTALTPAEDRDTRNLTLGYHHQYAFAQDAQLSMALVAGLDQAKGDNWDNQNANLEVSVAYPFLAQFTAEAYASVFKQNYTKTHSIFGVKRRDYTYNFSSILSYTPWQNWRFSLQYTRQSARSNIAVYTYNRNIVTAIAEFIY